MGVLLQLYESLKKSGVSFYNWDLDEEKAATIEMNGQYAVFMDFENIKTTKEETVIVAHEGGHISTGATHSTNSPYDLIEKHEFKAWKWAIKKLLPKEELIKAVKSGYREIWELAEYFNVTEDFMRKAVCWYSKGNLGDTP